MARSVRTSSTLFTALLLSATLVPSAWAASAQEDAYDGGGPAIVEATPAPSSSDEQPAAQNSAPSTTSASALPFTGLEAGLIGVAGLGLAGVGVSLRRAGRSQR